MSNLPDPLHLVGTMVDKYRIDEVVGQGGFAVVYKAEHVVWQEPVALKFMTILETAPDQHRARLIDDFVKEGKLMTRLSTRSSAIVQARDVGKLEQDGEIIPYMALEWIDGLPLDEILRAESLGGLPLRTVPQGVTLLRPTLEALTIAHEMRVAHRDLKPANIMVIGDARAEKPIVKVLDFGIAKIMQDQVALQEQLEQTGKHITAFTPKYGAPEQFSRDHGATGPWTDVYAAALILLEIVVGRPAFDQDSFFGVGRASCDPAIRPTPRHFGVATSDALDAVFRRALHIEPSGRYRCMGDFHHALETALQSSTGSHSTERYSGGYSTESNSSTYRSGEVTVPHPSQDSAVTPMAANAPYGAGVPMGRGELNSVHTAEPVIAQQVVTMQPERPKLAQWVGLAIAALAVTGAMVFLASSSGAPLRPLNVGLAAAIPTHTPAPAIEETTDATPDPDPVAAEPPAEPSAAVAVSPKNEKAPPVPHQKRPPTAPPKGKPKADEPNIFDRSGFGR